MCMLRKGSQMLQCIKWKIDLGWCVWMWNDKRFCLARGQISQACSLFKLKSIFEIVFERTCNLDEDGCLSLLCQSLYLVSSIRFTLGEKQKNH